MNNIYLGRIEKEMLRAVEEGRRRFKRRDPNSQEVMGQAELMEAIKIGMIFQRSGLRLRWVTLSFEMKARQMVGQPAGPGLQVAGHG